jgi:hypothetical protein
MGHFLKLKRARSPLNLRILSSTSVPCTLTKVLVLNLTLTQTERITVLSNPFLSLVSLMITTRARTAAFQSDIVDIDKPTLVLCT